MGSLRQTPVHLHTMGAGPSLVLLHCLGVDHHFWDFAEPLAAKYTLHSYDFPGHGETSVPNDSYTIADLSDQLGVLLKREGIARAHLAGISLGGLVAQHFAATEPRSVGGLILIDTTPQYTDQMQSMWFERAQTARQLGVSAMIDGLLKIWFSDAAVAADGVAVRYVRDTLSMANGEGYALASEALAAADLRLHAARIVSPTLIICGDNDIPSFLDAAKWLNSTILNSRLEWIPGTRHASVIEAPETALRLIDGFLQRLGRDTA